MQENIFNKLSMDDSGYDNHIQLIKNRDRGYTLEGEDKILSNCDFIDMSVPYAAEEDYYGYGIFTKDVELEGKVRKKVYHSGGIPGFFSSNNIFPTEDMFKLL